MEMNIVNVALNPHWKRAQRKGSVVGGRSHYKKEIEARLLPTLRAFNPDLIFVSAGFDAGKNDIGNSKIDKK
jgi:acetoin utilization deacetylase AcuC-like enzyme